MKKKNIDGFYPTITMPYNTWSDEKMSTGTKGIQDAMTDNEYFTELAEQIATYTLAVTAYSSALSDASSRDKLLVAAKDTKRRELTSLSIELGSSVSKICQGDLEMLLSSNFPLRKRSQPNVMGKPLNLMISATVNYELDVKVKPPKGALSFMFDCKLQGAAPESAATRFSCSTSQCTLTGLQSGKKYWITPGAVGTKEQITWGEPILSPYVQGGE